MLNIKRLWLTFTTTHTIIILLNFCTIAIMIPIQTIWQRIENFITASEKPTFEVRKVVLVKNTAHGNYLCLHQWLL